jgi:hypothetical protein
MTSLSTTESLISIAQISRSKTSKTILGKLRGQGNSFQRPEPMESPPLASSISTPTNFDTDAYRQEMTDLVYQKSMERAFS